jgi:hypothetical protein
MVWPEVHPPEIPDVAANTQSGRKKKGKRTRLSLPPGYDTDEIAVRFPDFQLSRSVLFNALSSPVIQKFKRAGKLCTAVVILFMENACHAHSRTIYSL